MKQTEYNLIKSDLEDMKLIIKNLTSAINRIETYIDHRIEQHKED